MRQIKTSVVNSLSGIAGAFALAGLVGFVRRAAEAGDEMLTLATRTGRTVESLSQLDFVARRGNTSIESLIKGQDQLAKKLGATDEDGKAAAKALTEIGLAADKIRSLSPDQQLDAIADAMGAITDPTTHARIAMTLFGKAGTDLLPVLTNGSDGIRELREEADRLGATMTELEAKRLSKLDDQIEATSAQFRKLKTEIAGILAQPLGSYFELVQKGLVGWRVLLSASGDEMEELNERATLLRLEMNKLQDAQRHGIGNEQANAARLQAIRDEIALIFERQNYLLSEAPIRARFEADMAAIRGKQAAASEAATAKAETEAEAAEKAAEAYAKWRAELTALVEQERLFNSLETKYPTQLLADSEFEREIESASDMIEKGAKEDERVFEQLYKDNAASFGQSMADMTVFADQAFRNMQTFAAEFLFDPFAEGLDGMLKGFVDILRRMVAEAAAARIFEALGLGSGSGSNNILGSILGGIFGSFGGGGAGGGGAGVPFMASGGYMPPGSLAVVGEGGPELRVAGRQGDTIIPFPKGGRGGDSISVTIAPTYSIDARGASVDLVQRLPQMLRESNKQAVAEAEIRIVEGLRRKKYSLS
jgi:hypothetical protein